MATNLAGAKSIKLQDVVAPWAGFVGLVFLILGLAVQEWDCQDCSVPTGGGYDDITWGTIATDWGLAIVYIPMALMAPGNGIVRAGFAGAAACDALGWFVAGLVHLIKAETAVFYVSLFIIATIGTTIGRIARVFGIFCAIRSVGPCVCVRNTYALAAIFGSIACTALVLMPPAEVGAIPIPGWILAAVYQILMVLLQFVFSTAAISKIRVRAIWAPVVAFLMFVVGMLVNQAKPSPFKYSTEFNDNGLFHTFFIWEAAASFHALRVLTQSPANAEPDIEKISEVEIKESPASAAV